jgi:hypothetical protein
MVPLSAGPRPFNCLNPSSARLVRCIVAWWRYLRLVEYLSSPSRLRSVLTQSASVNRTSAKPVDSTHSTNCLKTWSLVWKGTAIGRLLSRPSRGEMYAICRFVQRCRARAYRGRSPGFIISLSSSSASGKDSSASSNLLTISQVHNTRQPGQRNGTEGSHSHCRFDESLKVHLVGHDPEVFRRELSPRTERHRQEVSNEAVGFRSTHLRSATLVTPLVNRFLSSSVPIPLLDPTAATPFMYPQNARSFQMPASSCTSSSESGFEAEKNSSSGVRSR